MGTQSLKWTQTIKDKPSSTSFGKKKEKEFYNRFDTKAKSKSTLPEVSVAPKSERKQSLSECLQYLDLKSDSLTAS